MNRSEWLCLTCRNVRMSSSGTVTRCATIGLPEMAYRYGKCRRYQPKNRDDKGDSMFPDLKK